MVTSPLSATSQVFQNPGTARKKIKQAVKSPSELKPGRISIVGESHPSDCILRKRNVAIKVGACMKYAII